MSELGLDGVLIEKGKNPGEPWAITDKTGLGCDICGTVLEFGLYITKSVYLNQQPTASSSSPVYLLKLICLDRKGLLHDVTQVLCELDLAIQRVKVTTTPDGTVLNLFFIKDNMELPHTKNRQDELFGQINAVLGETCASCELQLISPGHDFHEGISALSAVVAEELFRSELSDKEIRSQALSPDMAKLKKTNVTLDNSLSPAHTLLQIHCIDHKGLLYDILRTLKDCSIKALNLPSQRPEILHVLFKDLALEVDDRAKAKLQADITSSTEGDLISPADYDLKDQLCFYDVLADIFLFADHSLWVPECGKPILHLIVQLWSQSFASHIFSLLFHKWLLEVQVDHSEDLLQYSSALVQGIASMLHCQEKCNAESGVIIHNVHPNDIFVIEVADQLQKVKVEPVLLHYLSHIKVLHGMELRMTTSS